MIDVDNLLRIDSERIDLTDHLEITRQQRDDAASRSYLSVVNEREQCIETILALDKPEYITSDAAWTTIVNYVARELKKRNVWA
jgi:hypothetical protein